MTLRDELIDLAEPDDGSLVPPAQTRSLIVTFDWSGEEWLPRLVAQTKEPL